MLMPVSLNVADLLNEGEKVIWRGTPMHGVRLRKGEILRIPVTLIFASFLFTPPSLIAGAFLSGQIHFAPGQGPSLFGMIAVLPFFVVMLLYGLYSIAGRFFHDEIIRAGTVYMVTNQRLLFWYGTSRTQVLSRELSALKSIGYTVEKDGLGTVDLVGDIAPSAPWRYRESNTGPLMCSVFDLIPNADVVCALIRNAKADLELENKLG